MFFYLSSDSRSLQSIGRESTGGSFSLQPLSPDTVLARKYNKHYVTHVTDLRVCMCNHRTTIIHVCYAYVLICFAVYMIGVTSVEEIREKIAEFEDRFKVLKRQTRQGLERLGPLASVKVVVERLTDLRADDKLSHKVFLEGKIRIMFRADDHFELFGTLNFHWDYLAYHLLDHLIREFSIRKVKGEMEEYKLDLQRFRRATPLMLFCQAQRGKRFRPPAEFREIVVEFDWPDTVTLEVVEDFRGEYASHYSLRECAMILVSLDIGSFLITWFIPESVVESLKVKIPEKLFRKHNVTTVEIGGDLTYINTENKNVSAYIIHVYIYTCTIMRDVVQM